jgi:hypothetical protein
LPERWDWRHTTHQQICQVKWILRDGFFIFHLGEKGSGGTNPNIASRSRSRSRQDDFTTGWEKERKKERKSVFEAVGLLTTTNPSCSDC